MKPELVNSLKGYNFHKFTKDIMSGVLVAIIALPLSIALGMQSGVTLQQGIITAIVAGFIISALGGSKYQIGGPTAAFVAIVSGYILDPEIGFFGLQLATIMAGIILLALGIFRLGRYIKFIPYPIVTGFTTGIGITLIIGQIKDVTGLTLASTGQGFFQKMGAIFSALSSTNLPTLCIGIATILLIILIPEINKKLPAAFIAIITVTIATLVIKQFDENCFGIATIGSSYGEIKAEVNFIDFRSLKNLKIAKLFMPAIVIAMLGGIESLLSCTVADSMAGNKHNSDMELVGQGVANMASPIFGGLPATGAIARTAANINNGAISPVSGIVHSIVLLLIFVLLMPIMKYIPMAALGAVLIVVAINMSKFKQFFKLTSLNAIDTIVLISTCVLTVIEDLVVGVVGGMLIMIVLEAFQFFKGLKIVIEDNNIFVSGYINFISVDKLVRKIDSIIVDYSIVNIDLTDVKMIDMSGVSKLVKTINELHNKEIELNIFGGNKKCLKALSKGDKLFVSGGH